LSEVLTNPYRYVVPESQTCQGESYTGDSIGVGQDYPSGQITLCGMIPLAGNTLIGTIANKFSLLMELQGSVSDLEIGAKIYDDSDPPEEQAQSIDTINDVASGSFNFRQFEFADDFEVTVNYFYVIYGVDMGTFSNANRINIRMQATTPIDDNTVGYYAGGWYDRYFTNERAISICFTG